MHPKRWIVVAVVVFLAAFVVWIVLSLRNDDSTVSVVARSVKNKMCWPADSSAVCMLKTMAKYEKKGRYDDAVRIGVALAEKYPDSVTSGWVYEDISGLYLTRARMDSTRRRVLEAGRFLSRQSTPVYIGQPVWAAAARGSFGVDRRSLHGSTLRSIWKFNQAA